MQAGKLDKRVMFQTKQATRDSDGAEIVVWVNAFAMWASVSPIAGREYAQLKALEEEQTTRIVCRYRSLIKPTMRAVVDGHTYDIIDVRNIELGNTTLELMCREVEISHA